MNDTSLQNTSNITSPSLKPCHFSNERLVYMVIYCIIILLVVSGNAFVLLRLFISQTRRRTNLELLIAYLSTFDLLASVVIIVDVYENLTCFRKWLFGWFGCMVIYQTHHVSLNMSICILLIMSLDRCRSLVRPMKNKFSQTWIHIVVFISLALSIGAQSYQIINISFKNGKCVYAKTLFNYALPKVLFLSIRDILFIIIFTITSTWIYVSLLRDKCAMFYPDRKIIETKRVVIMLIVMEVVFTLLVIPYDIFDIVMLVHVIYGKRLRSKTIIHLDYMLSSLQMCNSFANCFIYAKMHRYIKLRVPNGSRSLQSESRRSCTSTLSVNDKQRNARLQNQRESIQSTVFNLSLITDDSNYSIVDNRKKSSTEESFASRKPSQQLNNIREAGEFEMVIENDTDL